MTVQILERQGGHGSSPARHISNKPVKVRAPRRVSLENFTLKDIPDIPTETVIESLHEDEYGDGGLFAELFIGRCVFDHTDSKWYTWQGHYWKDDSVQLVRHLVSGVLASTYMKAAAEVNLWLAHLEQTSSADDDTEHTAKIKQHKDTIRALYARSHALKMSNRMKNVLGYAASFLAITSDKWDTHKWLLGTLDGVIELGTGTMRDGKPEDYIRTVIPATWQGLEAQCPRFERFLEEIFEDRTEQERDELIRFLHRAFGYGLTGLCTVHIFLMLFGDEGRNGKDTLMKVILKVLGDTVGAVSNDVMISGGKFVTPGAAKPHLVSLQGKRIAWASETDRGARFDIGQVKFLTGGGTIPTRQLYGKDYTFEPSHLLVLLTNNKPHADAKDKAFWERICPITFNVRFVENPSGRYEHKADDKLGDVLEAEASGILAWLVRGCMAWQAIGLNVPAGVLAERAKYRDEEDTLGLFLTEHCLASVECRVKPQVLYNKYVEWANLNNIKPMSGTIFGTEIGKMYKKVHTMEGNFYQGIGLRDDYPQLAEAMDKPPTPDTPSPDEPPTSAAPTLENEQNPEALLDESVKVLRAIATYNPAYIAVDNKNGDTIEYWGVERTITQLTDDLHTQEYREFAIQSLQSSLPVWRGVLSSHQQTPPAPASGTSIESGAYPSTEQDTTTNTEHRQGKPARTWVTIYADIRAGQALTEQGVSFTFTPDCSLSLFLAAAHEFTGQVHRVFLCGARPGGDETPEAFINWLADMDMMESYTTDKRGHFFDTLKPDSCVARYVGRASRTRIDIRRIVTWLGDDTDEQDAPLYSIEEARAAMGLVTRYLRQNFAFFKHVSGTPSTTFKGLWTEGNRIAGKQFEPLPEDIRTLIHPNAGQGRIEFYSEHSQGKIPGLYYYDGIFMYAALTWGLPTEVATHDTLNEYAGKVPARYRIRYTVPANWQHVGLFMTKQEPDGWYYPGAAEAGNTYETWADGAELDVAYNLPQGMPAWDITILERVIFKPEKESTATKPLETITSKLVGIREQIDTDKRQDAARVRIYTLARGAIRNILLHGIGSFNRTRKTRTFILLDTEPAPVGYLTYDELDEHRRLYTVLEESTDESMTFPQWVALIWARCRARMTKHALSRPYSDIVAIRTDAIAVTRPVAAWEANNNATKAGVIRRKWAIERALPAPATSEKLDELQRKLLRK